MTEPFAVECPGLVWMAVHGACCLGLRHPGYTGPSRELVLNFVNALSEKMVETGVLTSDELAIVEQEERPRS